MAKATVRSFTIASATRIRIAGGDVQFAFGDKLLDNSKLEDSWHTFPAGTEFTMIASMKRTQTFLLQAKERTVTKLVPEGGGKSKRVEKTELFGIFIRGMSYDKLLVSAGLPKECEPEVTTEAPVEDAPAAEAVAS